MLRIINEPTSAALSDGVIEVLATAGDNHLGGDDFDARVANYLVQEFKKEHKVDLSREAQATWSKVQQLLKDEKKTMDKNRRKQLKKDSDTLQKALSRLRVDKVTPEQIENTRQAKAQLEITLG